MEDMDWPNLIDRVFPQAAGRLGDIAQAVVGIVQVIPGSDKTDASLGWDIASAVAEVDIHTALTLAVAAARVVEIVLVAKMVFAADNKSVVVVADTVCGLCGGGHG